MATKYRVKSPFSTFLSAIVMAGGSVAEADYYVSTLGNDATGNGTYSNPWGSVSFALTQVTGTKSIYVLPGEYTESDQWVVPIGVSVFGSMDASNQTIINVAYNDGDTDGSPANPNISFLYLGSSIEGTNGNQSISYLTFQATAGATRLGQCRARSNVAIHNCTILDFFADGFTFNGQANEIPGTGPLVHAEGNSFHHNTVINCSKYSGYGHGCLQIGGQIGFLCYSNTIVQQGRPTATNGYCIKYYMNGYNNGLKIYNNNLYKSFDDGTPSGYLFAIEMWYYQGIEVYDNTICGGIDLVVGSVGAYGFTAKFYNNLVGPAVQPTYTVGVALEFEYFADTVYCYNNVFRNTGYCVLLAPTVTGNIITNINVYNNITLNSKLFGQSGTALVTLSNVNIINNTCYRTSGPSNEAIHIPYFGTSSNYVVDNNILVGYTNAGIVCNNGTASNTMSNLTIRNNLFYNCGSSNGVKFNDVASSTTYLSGYVNTGNLVGDPLFKTAIDTHILTASPAKQPAGIYHAAITTDFDGVIRANPPSIGAYEYV